MQSNFVSDAIFSFVQSSSRALDFSFTAMPPNASKPRALSRKKLDILRRADVIHLVETRKASLSSFDPLR